MARKIGRKKILGVELQGSSRTGWTWELDGLTFFWDPERLLRVELGQDRTPLSYCRCVVVAVAYSLGYVKGRLDRRLFDQVVPLGEEKG